MLRHWYGCDPGSLNMLQYNELLERITDIREMTEDVDSKSSEYTRRKLERMMRRKERGLV